MLCNTIFSNAEKTVSKPNAAGIKYQNGNFPFKLNMKIKSGIKSVIFNSNNIVIGSLPLIHPHHSLSLILRFSFSTFLLHTSLSLGCCEKLLAVEMCNSAKPYFLIIGPCSIVTCCTRIIGTNTRFTTKRPC